MNNTALAIIQSEELETIQRTGKMLAASGYFDAKGEGNQAIAMMATKIMAGREMGFGPFASVNGVHIIKGKPTVGANLMAAAVKGSGRYNYRVREMTNEVCKLEFFERMGDKWESVGVSEFTKADANKAGTQNMDKFPRNMLFARAMSNGVRWHCPDVFSGNVVYVPEELGADVDEDGNVVDAAFTVTAQDAPQQAQRSTVADSYTEPRITQQRASVEPDGDVLFEVEKKAQPKVSPPHQRMWGCGIKVFGTDWDMARPWLIKQWTKHVSPDNIRDSSSDLNDDEKDMLADYLNDNITSLTKTWPKQKALMLKVAA